MSGKGSKRRPSAISDATYAENYARTFKGPERIDAIMQREAVPMPHCDTIADTGSEWNAQTPYHVVRPDGTKRYYSADGTEISGDAWREPKRVVVPMHHKDKAIAAEPHGEATRITPKTELKDPYA